LKILTGPYRAGPWPGLTQRGALVLLACAVLMALAEALVGLPHQPLPDLPLYATVALLPLVIATRTLRAPGAASAVCGAYLLPRTLLSLLASQVEVPPLLLISSLAFDAALWLRASDLALGRSRWRRRTPRPVRTLTRPRSAIAGALFGLTLALVQPPFAILLGGDPGTWSNTSLAAVLTMGGCTVVGLWSASGRGTAS
jgi:hypothetical protein